MNKKNFALAVVFSVFLIVPSAVHAEETVSIQLRIEGPTNTFLNTTISVPETCSVIDTTTTTPHDFDGYKAICALQTVQEQGLLTYQVTDWGWGFSLDKINETANATDWSQTWIIRINNATAQTGIDGLVIHSGDNLLITYGPWPMEPLQIISSTSTPEVNTELGLQAKVWDDTANNFVDFTNKSIFWIDDKSYESSSGTLWWTADAEGPKQIRVEAEGKTRSDSQTINIIPIQQTTTSTEPVAQTNRVMVNYLNEEIFNNDVSATSTWFYDSAGAFYSTSTISALGVLAEASRQGNFSLTIQGGWGYYVTSVDGHAAQGFDGWIYNINQQDPGWVGMNDYQIKNNDLLTVFYSVWPWKIESNTSSVYLGENIAFTAFNYASSTWQTSASTTISINNQLFVTGDNGQYIYTPTATGTLSAFIYGSKSWPQNSPTINVAIIEPMSTSTPPVDNPPPANNGGSPGSESQIISSAVITEKARTILNFLKSQQSEDGKIIDGGVTDWAVMAFGADHQYAEDVKKGQFSLWDYAKAYDFTDASEMNLCAAYPRHILALLAGGVDKTDAKIIELKTKIKNQCFSSADYGENGINDDIFGLFALLAIGESVDATSTQSIINSIKSDQTANGAFTWAGWPGADITGASINALKYASSNGADINPDIFTKAKNYLKSTQLNDGGWGCDDWPDCKKSDVLTTSWAIMGIDALGEGQADWLKNASTTPWHILVNNLKEGGYYEPSWAPGTTDWFATKHAVPALMGKSWPIILAPKSSPASTPSNGVGGSTGTFITNNDLVLSTSSATSTLPVVPVFSVELSTSTLAETQASSTAEIVPVGSVSESSSASVNSAPLTLPLKSLSSPIVSETSEIIKENNVPVENELTMAPTPSPSSQTSPLLPLEKKVAEGAAASSAAVFAGMSLLLVVRLLLAAL